AGAGGIVFDDLAIAVADHRAVFFVAVAPTADADHLVVFLPLGKGIVGGVVTDKAAAVAHEVFKSLAGFFGPGCAVVVADDNLVFGEVGMEIVVGAAGFSGGDVDGEDFCAFQGGFEQRCRGLPIVIVLAVDNQHADRLFFVGGAGAGDERKQCEREDGENGDTAMGRAWHCGSWISVNSP